MKTRNHLPLMAHRIGAIAATLQIAISVSTAAIMSPGYRGFHLGLACVHLAMLVFWIYLGNKAKRAVPVKPKKAMSLADARSLQKSMISPAVSIGGMALFAIYMICAPDPSMPYPHSQWQAGNVLTGLGILVNALMISGIMMVVARQCMEEAKAAALEAQTVEQGEVVTSTRSGWWTQDETRQELRRK